MLVYVFCYNDATARRAEMMAKDHNFLRPYRLGASPYFESQFFFMNLLPYHEWMQHDYIGFISYKYLEKVGDDKLGDMPDLCKVLGSCDVIALNDLEFEVLEHGRKMHGQHFVQCWHSVLEPFYTEEQRCDRDIPAFYCNYWIARPHWAIEYCRFAQKVKAHIDAHPNLREMLFENSGYRGQLKPHELVGITKRPYYTYHAFVFERLPCLFFHQSEAVIGRRRLRSVWSRWDPLTQAEVEALVPEQTTSLCLFATHTDLDHFAHNILVYLDNLSQQFELVLVLTTQAEISNAEHIPRGCKIRKVINQCHDFGIWFRVLRNLPKRNLKRLALVNDSCTILSPLHEVFARASVHPEWKFWGITDSQEVQPHLQTYFVVAHDEVIDLLQAFARQARMSPREMHDKWFVVREFEIGLSAYMLAHGVAINAVFPFSQVKHCQTTMGGQGANPSLALWDRLLVLGCPLLKKRRLHYRQEQIFINNWIRV